jgi:hypothetical protein
MEVMTGHEFLYVTQWRQIAYSPTRAALAEYIDSGRGWKFDGWLWDGNIIDRADAVAKTASYVGIFNETGQQS